MKKYPYLFLAALLALGTSSCKEDDPAQDGQNGQNGQNGDAGSDGSDGHDGKDGKNAGNFHIIAVTAIDEAGAEHDDTILVDFAQDVSDMSSEIKDTTITFSYGHRKGVQLKARGIAGGDGLIVATVEEDTSTAKGAGVLGDGVLSANSTFYLETNDPTVVESNTSGWAEKLAKAMSEAIGIPDAFMVSAVKTENFDAPIGNSYDGLTKRGSVIKVLVMKDIPLTRFDEEGNDVGIVVTIPAFTITDYAGNGNVATSFRLIDNVTASQAEPEGVAFNPAKDHESLNTTENCILETTGFNVSFNQPMDVPSTELAIKRRLEETPLLQALNATVTVTEKAGSDGKSFIVKPSKDLDLWALSDPKPTADENYEQFVSCALDLVLDKWDVTNAYGITNTNKAITFALTDISHPFVTYRTEQKSDYQNVVTFNDGNQFPYEYDANFKDDETIMVTLKATNETDTSAAKREENRYLEQGDKLQINFSEMVNDSPANLGITILKRISANMEKLNGSKWQAIDDSSELDLKKSYQCSNTATGANGTIGAGYTLCVLTIPANYRLPVGSDYIVNAAALENDSVVDSKGANNIAVKQIEPRALVASTDNWIVSPSIVKQPVSGEDESLVSAQVVINSISSESKPTKENITLQNGDSITVTFNKHMNAAITKQHLAYVFGQGALKGATRYVKDPNGDDAESGDFTVATNQITSSSWNATDRKHSFTFTLKDGQFIKMDKKAEEVSFSMAANEEGVISLDVVRLAVNEDEPIVIKKQQFDPEAAPTLVKVEGAYNGGRYCGNGIAEANDTITFTFSEPLRSTEVVQDGKASVALVKAAIAEKLKTTILAYSSTNINPDHKEAFMALNADDVVSVISSGDAVFTATIKADPADEYDASKAFNKSTNRPRFQMDVSKAITFDFDSNIVVDKNGIKAEQVKAIMDPFDILDMDVAVLNNVIENDGTYAANDSFMVTFNCGMDDFYTLSAVQEGFDTLMGDGVAYVTAFNDVGKDSYDNSITVNKGFQVKVLPGQEFSSDKPMILSVKDVATQYTAGEDRIFSTIIAGPFTADITDANVADVTLTFIPGSNVGTNAQYKAPASMAAGIWELSGVSGEGMGRVSLDLPIVFSAE